MMRLREAACATAILLAGVQPSQAEVTRFEVASTQQQALDGRTFGEAGQVEKIVGRATIAVDPADARNAIIADISLAPRNPDHRVEAVADVVVLRPARPNGILLLEAPNRGRKLIGSLFEDSPAEAFSRLERAGDAGRGFLLSRGYTLAWVGWQGDIAPGGAMRIDLPIVSGVTGPSREEWVFDHRRSPVEAALTWPAADLDPAKARLTVRARPSDPRAAPAELRVRFLGAQRIEIVRPQEGFDASALYELVYEARDPTVTGLGFAAIRDVATFLKHEGGPNNPLALHGRTGISRAVGFGVSQSGRVLRDFLYLGFNEDERGRIVFDGLMPYIAGSRRSFTNARFAQPGRNPSPHVDRYYPVDQFPFSYTLSTDALTGRRDGLLVRCRLTNTCPKIMHVDNEYEMWGSRGALITTDTQGAQLELPPDVRAFMITGAPHAPAPSGTTTPNAACELPASPVHGGAPARALLTALTSWISDEFRPPESRYPSRAHGTLARAEGLYPPIPGLPYSGLYNPAEWVEQASPYPVIRGTYPLLLPRVDGDGNTLGGIRMPLIEASRATYTAWNPMRGQAAATLCNHLGGVLPYAATKSERIAAGDPRLSLEERYPSQGAYVGAVRVAADRLVSERLLLPEDATEMVEAAASGTLAR
ncbi:alpha/beta hydrolase domain-containing protein [Methylobacterium sp.]|uniref:alpha/beta hydrolase domain-containing protein n=1 Tax=Methylobacterium sp. TaxID=409 RepID=UPI0025F2512E|nr:alpha/beta hydrolase domain-containing protein [Methylobacterium sp.]